MVSSTVLLVNRVRLLPDASVEEAFSIARARVRRLGIPTKELSFSLFKKSVDARRKSDVHFVCTVAVNGIHTPLDPDVLKAHDMSVIQSTPLSFSFGKESLSASPVIVGAGPCGLFCALLLAEQGYRPVILERGGCVEERRRCVERFYKTRHLDPNTNIQFGAGGAGTFSDGKLVCRVGDPLTEFVLKTFVRFGAPQEILYMAKPHIGTDVLSGIVERMLEHIVALGGTVMYHTQFLKPIVKHGTVIAVQTDKAEFSCGALILAIGHSARDTYASLMETGLAVEAKAFSVGMRIEHRARDIDEAMYGSFAGHPALGHAEYTLSHNTKERGVYTFCMCPGGTVVAAASEPYGVVVNGMSEHARDGENSNCAVLCSIFKDDYGATPTGAIELARSIEHAAYLAGGSDYSVPLTTVGDFLNDTRGHMPSRIQPTYMNGDAFTLASVSDYLPPFVCKALKEGLLAFDRRIHGFAVDDAILSGAETRTSAPLRLLRSKDTYLALGFSNVYPAGEGAGYAGGITSASLDGLHTAMHLMERFAPLSSS